MTVPFSVVGVRKFELASGRTPRPDLPHSGLASMAQPWKSSGSPENCEGSQIVISVHELHLNPSNPLCTSLQRQNTQPDGLQPLESEFSRSGFYTQPRLSSLSPSADARTP